MLKGVEMVCGTWWSSARVSVIVGLILVGLSPARAAGNDPDHFRGQVIAITGSAIDIRTKSGATQRIQLVDQVTFLKLAPASFADVDFGTYVGAVSEKIGDEIYSPIYRDSLSWLHRGLELRIIEENLRGIAVGHRKWDLTPDSVMTHGWVDDLEIRVLSIKYGPTEAEETDVEIARDLRILRMGLGDRGLVRQDAHIFAGARKGAGGYVAEFVMVGVDGVVPGL